MARSVPVGPESPRWKGGRIVRLNGYACVRVNGAYVYEHRHVMAQHLGRELARQEVVHHRNGDRLDNRIENLELLDKRSHDSLTSKASWAKGERVGRRRKLSPAADTELSDLRAAGHTVSSIARVKGLTRTSVRVAIRRARGEHNRHPSA
jgi:hypothetical protein